MAKPTPVPAAVVDRVRDRIEAHAGLKLPGWVLEARLAARLAALQVDHPADYADLVASPAGSKELDHLLEALRVGETRFFRHLSHVKALTDVVVPALRGRRGGAVRAWSAGCATGEEAYTLAMVLTRLLPAPTWEVSVTASDLSAEALEVARRGCYPAAALSHVPAAWRGWGFEAIDPVQPVGDWRIADPVAAAVKFERRNLADGGFPRGFDVIWCRNVLIYFAPEARDRVVERLVDSLNPGGFLFVGYAESLRDFDAVEAVSTPDAVLYRKAFDSGAVPAPPLRPSGGVAARPAGTGPSTTTSTTTTTTTSTSTWSSTEAGRGKRGSGRRVVPEDVRAEEAVIELRGRYEDEARLTRELGDAMSGPYASVVVDLDGADYLGDGAAAVLRRARSAARAAGIGFTLVASRPGPLRWLRRSGLEEAPR